MQAAEKLLLTHSRRWKRRRFEDDYHRSGHARDNIGSQPFFPVRDKPIFQRMPVSS